MSKEMVISANPHETRVAILEEGQLCEYYVERDKEFALVGSIYKGKVTRVLPGMQSAFVEIGLDSDAFLYVSDFLGRESRSLTTYIATAADEKIKKLEEQGGQIFPTASAVIPAIEALEVEAAVEASGVTHQEPADREAGPAAGSELPPVNQFPVKSTSAPRATPLREPWPTRKRFWAARRAPRRAWWLRRTLWQKRPWRTQRPPTPWTRVAVVEIRIVRLFRRYFRGRQYSRRARLGYPSRRIVREI